MSGRETPRVSKAQVAIVMGIVTTVASGVWYARGKIADDDRAECESREERLILERDKCQNQLLRLLVPSNLIVETAPMEDADEERVEIAEPDDQSSALEEHWNSLREMFVPLLSSSSGDDSDGADPPIGEGTGEDL